jgi:hypothetical protein
VWDRISGSFADRQSRIIAALLASTVLVVIIVLVASGTFSGGDDEGNGNKDSANFDSVPVELTAPAGSDAKGNAVFTNVGDRTNQISFQISASGLDPTPKGSTYTIWLYIDPKHAYPLAPVTVPANGKLTATRPIPNIFTTTQTGLAVLARFQKVRLSLTPTKQLAALVSAAVKKQTPLVPYIGKTALEGDIPGSVRGAAQGGTGTQPGATTTQP